MAPSTADMDSPAEVTMGGVLEEEILTMPRKRGSPLRSSSDNERKSKRSKGASEKPRSSQESVSNDEGGAQEKENNGSQRSFSSKGNSKRRKSSNAATEKQILGGRHINPANKPPEAGIVTKIYVENFMCHKKLTVDLCRNINFIYGQNGSGKSAILAALQICLGAGARRTNRARNLKELVRKDTSASCAKLRVTLLNRGDDAFQPDQYGETITVERTIAVKGGYNGFKLFGADGVERSRSKKDLYEMLDKLNIQVENPVAILDQEEAKKFLTGKARDKYNFFMKATELERIDNSFANTMNQLLEMKTQSDRLQQALMADEDLMRETKRAYKKHQEIGKLETKRAKLQVNFAWSNYKASSDDQLAKVQRFEKFKEKAEKKKEELTQAEAATQESDDPNDERRNQLDALSKEANEMSIRKCEKEQELRRAKEPQRALKRQYKLLEVEEKRAKQGLLDANKRLQAKRDEIAARAGSAESDQAKRNQRLNAAEERLTLERGRYNEIKQAVTDSYNAYEDIAPEVQGAREILSRLEHQMRGAQSSLQSLESSSGNNSVDVFGRNCAKVKQMVDQAIRQNRFRGPVLGPIGAYCKIQSGKEQYAELAEQAIGKGFLDRFIVFNDADRKHFQELRRSAGCRTDCSVFQQSSHQRYNIPPPPEGVETVATVLSIEDNGVFNCLVDQARIDSKALCRSKSDSESRLLVKNQNNRLSIRGGTIKEVYFMPRGDNWRVVKGNIQLISNTQRPKRTIGVDRTGAIEDARIEYETKKQEVIEKKRDLNKLEHEHTTLVKKWNQNKRELQKNERAMDDAEKEITEIKAEEANSVDLDIDTIEEEEEVASAQAHLEEIQENQRKAQEMIKEKEPEIKELEDKVDEITSRNAKVIRDLEEAEQSLSQHYEARNELRRKVEKKRQKLAQYEELLNEHTAIVSQSREETEEFLRMAKIVQFNAEQAEKRREEREASQDGEMMNTQISQYNDEPTEEDLENIPIPDALVGIKDAEYYAAKIQLTDSRIEQEKKRRLENGDDEATAYEKYVRATKVYKAKKNQIDEIETTSRKLEVDMSKRQQRWQQFRDYISEYTDMKFDETLNIKKSSGKLEIDHRNQELNLIVYKDASNEQSQQKDVKALSGGERSFTTIALLLGLGESLETPFRVMDEFDVFLDPKARSKVIQTLIDVGMQMSHRQFIFITPQDVSNVDTSPMIKILQMKPPVRRTVAGGHEQQTLEFPPSQQ